MRLAVLVLSAISGLCAQSPPAFEVAVLKPSKANIGHDGEFRFDPGRISVRNATLRRIMVEAWQIPYSQITGGPAWLTSDEFDIDAKADAPATPAEMRRMLQALLIDRFHMAVRTDSRERKIYVLSVAKGGPKLTPDPVAPPRSWRFHGTLKEFAARLSTQLTIPFSNDPATPSFATGAAIPVIDKTGIEGEVTIAIDLRPDAGGDAFTVWQRALREQLGLRLESSRGVADALVIDHVMKLSADPPQAPAK